MLRNVLFVLCAGAAAGTISFLAACGDGGTNSTGSGGGGTVHGVEPPDRPSGNTPGDGPGTVFAIKKLYLGDTDRNGAPDPTNGWKNFGYDLDGKITDCSGNDCQSITDQCKPSSGGSPSDVYPDGNNGIDNAFGHTLLPIITGIAMDASTQINDAIKQGKFTIMFDVEKLGSKDTYNPLTTKLYGGGDLMATPKFDGSDKWPLIYELLNNGNKDSPKVQFNNSYVVSNTWVSGDPGTVDLQLSVAGFALDLNIQHAIISFEMSGDHKSATNGTLAGVLDTEAFTTELKQIAGSFDPSLCQGSAIDSIINQIRQASDIMKDGTSGSGSDTCNGISIGLGFDAGIVQLGDVAPKSMGTGDPCAAQ